MKINGQSYRTIWIDKPESSVSVIDQTRLPHEFAVIQLHSLEDACRAIECMQVRGAPLIGATAAYGIGLAMRDQTSDEALQLACKMMLTTRPTAVNLRWAMNRMEVKLLSVPERNRLNVAFQEAADICDEDVALCSSIGDYGLSIIEKIAASKDARDQPVVNILTHCNAGWLATVDWGTALAPIYKAFNAGIPIHVWVDETRPRNQGASLTAWELQQHGVDFTVIVDNAGGHLMQHGLVDLCIVGTDRTAANGDVCNKIGTYLKALAAADNKVPFYVALPSPTIDWSLHDGFLIPIEERGGEEISHLTGKTDRGKIETVSILQAGVKTANYAFDVTPARLVTGLITEKGICPASSRGLSGLFR